MRVCRETRVSETSLLVSAGPLNGERLGLPLAPAHRGSVWKEVPEEKILGREGQRDQMQPSCLTGEGMGARRGQLTCFLEAGVPTSSWRSAGYCLLSRAVGPCEAAQKWLSTSMPHTPVTPAVPHGMLILRRRWAGRGNRRRAVSVPFAPAAGLVWSWAPLATWPPLVHRPYRFFRQHSGAVGKELILPAHSVVVFRIHCHLLPSHPLL